MNRLAPLVTRPARNGFDPAGVVFDPPAMAWSGPAAQADAAPRRWQDDARLFLAAWAAGVVFFGTLFA